MMKYLIIEDDVQTVTNLKEIISNHFPDIFFSGDAPSIIRATELIKEKEPDFIFLDVNLEDGESFEILKRFPNSDFKIIFVTSYSKYAVEAFKFSALDFILKPFEKKDIIDVVNKIINEHNRENYVQKIETFFHNYNNTGNKRLVLKNLDEIHIVNTDDIIYIKSDNNYSSFFLTNDKKIVVSKTLKSFEEKLKGMHFFRSHQSYIINLNLAQSFDKKNDTIVLSDTIILPVAQSKKSILIDILDKLG